jgi:hypothetical protein
MQPHPRRRPRPHDHNIAVHRLDMTAGSAMAAIEFSGGRRESRTALNVDLEEALCAGAPN